MSGQDGADVDWSVLDGLTVFLQGDTACTGDLFIAPGRNDREPLVFMALREVTEFTRSTMADLLTRAFKKQVPSKAQGAAMEAVRLMEKYATTNKDMVVMVFTTPVSNEAWMKVGIDPVLGDVIASQVISAERSNEGEA